MGHGKSAGRMSEYMQHDTECGQYTEGSGAR